VAALVDLTPEEKDGAKTPSMTLAEAQDIIKQAVGFKTGRDEIKVTQVRLPGAVPDTLPEQEWETMQRWQTIANLVRQSSLGIAALAALVMGWMVLKRLRPAPPGTPPAPAEVEPTPEKNPMLERLSLTAQQNPEALARILANWLEQSDRPQRTAA
jgi:flagellar M-ring protein FliF